LLKFCEDLANARAGDSFAPIDGGESATGVTHGENGKREDSELMKRNGGISAAANGGWRNSKS
jgi:hypothetical protein